MRWPWQRRRMSLAERVRRALERGGVSMEALSVVADGARVTIRGAVPSITDLRRVVALADAVDGVDEVESLLEIVAPPDEVPVVTVRGQPNAPIYIAQAGDTLESIAERLLGNRARWLDVLRLNERVVSDPYLLQPGLRLRVPEK